MQYKKSFLLLNEHTALLRIFVHHWTSEILKIISLVLRMLLFFLNLCMFLFMFLSFSTLFVYFLRLSLCSFFLWIPTRKKITYASSWDLVVTSNENHRIIQLFNIIKILNKFKIFKYYLIRKFINNIDLKKIDF